MLSQISTSRRLDAREVVKALRRAGFLAGEINAVAQGLVKPIPQTIALAELLARVVSVVEDRQARSTSKIRTQY